MKDRQRDHFRLLVDGLGHARNRTRCSARRTRANSSEVAPRKPSARLDDPSR